MRRLCDARSIPYDAQKTSLAKLQMALYQPSKQIEVISSGENKQITAWGETRNNADHGCFDKITHSEVIAMVLGNAGIHRQTSTVTVGVKVHLATLVRFRERRRTYATGRVAG